MKKYNCTYCKNYNRGSENTLYSGYCSKGYETQYFKGKSTSDFGRELVDDKLCDDFKLAYNLCKADLDMEVYTHFSE